MEASAAPRRSEIALPGRGAGTLATLEFGPSDRPVDLLFLHANGFCGLTYRSLLAPLGADYRILAIDQRGHGRTSLPAEAQGRGDWLDMRDDLLTFLETANIGDAVLAGHSMGGTVSLLAAAERAEARRSLVLIDPVIVPSQTVAGGGAGSETMSRAALRRRAHFPSRAAAVEAYVGRGAFATWPHETIADFCEDGLRDLPDGTVELACAPSWEASSYAAQRHDPWNALRTVAGPVHILRAEQDSTCRIDADMEALTATGRVRVETVAGTTHFLPMERPDTAGAALLAAIRAR